MITINLLPQNQRRVTSSVSIPYKPILLIAVAGLLFLHFFMFVFFVVKNVQYGFLKGAWASMAPETKLVNTRKGEIKDLENSVSAMKASLTRSASFTELFSGLNAAVPAGLWLERFTYSKDGLVIQGSVVSLNQNEMTIVGRFLQDLRNAPSFSSLFAKIELNSVQRRTLKNFDVVDFVLLANLKAQETKK